MYSIVHQTDQTVFQQVGSWFQLTKRAGTTKTLLPLGHKKTRYSAGLIFCDVKQIIVAED